LRRQRGAGKQHGRRVRAPVAAQAGRRPDRDGAWLRLPYRPGRRMKSLKRRILTAVLAALLLNWGVWLGWQAFEMGRRETGTWDARLRDVASQAMLSMPLDIMERSEPTGFRLPEPAPTSELRMSFQIWSMASRRQIVH